MSSTAPPQLPTLDVTGTDRVPLSRLVRVEARKMVDTRGGFWLMLISGILLVITVAIVLLVVALDDTARVSAYAWSQILIIPLSLLLPVFAILTVTTEWSQRSGLVTFALEPNRLRVMQAKLASVVLFALSIVVLALVLGAIGNVVGASLGGYDASWNLGARVLVATLVQQILFFLMAFGIGSVLLNTPGAIAIFYVVALLLPFMVYGTLYALFDWAQKVIPWIDLQFGTMPFVDNTADIEGIDVARAAVVVLIWVVTPLVLGARRIASSEPK
jgi:ABC-2 type transport system permease protein